MSGKEYIKTFMVFDNPGSGDLVPVVTQDADTKEVLILSFANREAYRITRETGYACYWSRSRNELWRKGETSGDRLRIVEIRVNCEQNSLLYMVRPEGSGACHAKRRDGSSHTGCYYRKVNHDGSLEFLED